MEIHISVRTLVEFLLREGDIDNRRGVSGEQAMQEGAKLHRIIQKSRGAGYQAEVPLSLSYVMELPNVDITDAADSAEEDETALPDSAEKTPTNIIAFPNAPKEYYAVVVEGRADGIVPPPGNAMIEEIKCTYTDLRHIEAPSKVHLAQALCYAYIYATDLGLPEIDVQMTYCNIDTQHTKEFTTHYTYEELCAWFTELMAKYKRWSDYAILWGRKRTESIQNTSFPFMYRDGQRELVSHVYTTIVKKKKLFIEAPTGVGKTISTMYPAIQAMGRDMCERIFYLTAKTVTGKVAVDTLSLLREKGTRLKSVYLTAKDKVCILEEPECNPASCPYAKGHYDRINDAVYDMLTHEECFDREVIAKYAEKHEVCPFEMSLDMSLFADVVICDYNYLFDPHVRLKRFFGDGSGGEYIFLIDEAHNLVDRGRGMYSAELYKEEFLRLKRLFEPIEPSVARAAERVNKILLSYKRECEGDYHVIPLADDFVFALTQLNARLQDFFDEEDHRKARGQRRPDGINTEELRKEIIDLYFDINHFLSMYEFIELGYVIYTEILEDGRFMIRLFCVDPSELLKMCMQMGRSSILFSATLLPIEYYKKLLGHEPGDYEVYAHSVFDPDRKGLFIASDVTSLYKRRSEEMYRNIAEYILRVVRCRQGNYMVFFPSHAFMENCLSHLPDLTDLYDDSFTFLVQKERMDEQSREEFLSAFSTEHNDSFLVGMCVLGGIFSEGIDLKGDSLIGALVVGTGMPQVGVSQSILKDYFDDDLGRGFDYAYRYPGMNKVLQAAGRVIRTASDVGLVVLLDDRFRDFAYRKLFPREWESYTIVSLNDVEKRTNAFWNEWLT